MMKLDELKMEWIMQRVLGSRIECRDRERYEVETIVNEDVSPCRLVSDRRIGDGI